MTEHYTVKVVSIPSGTGENSSLSLFQTHKFPPRSRLYGLVPRGVGTIWTESLTSYINRLAWSHKVSGGELVAQELAPRLRSDYPSYQFTVFCRYAAMGLNGNGELARTYSALLEELTGRFDLSSLSLQRWIGNLSSRGQLQRRPAWCSACYVQWQEQGVPMYQPLLWQYQVVTLCPEHKQFLETQCPQCLKLQSVIATNRFQPGECTQCGAWLGLPVGVQPKHVHDDEIVWQQWVIRVLEDLYQANYEASPPQWEHFFAGVAACLQEPGAFFRLKRLTGVTSRFLKHQINDLDDPHSYTPLLKTILKFCYACDVTPLQIMSNQLSSIKALVGKRTPRRTRSHRQAPDRIDRQKCLEFMQAIIDGKKEPISLTQVAKRLGYGDRTLAYNFPQECALIIQRGREYRKHQQEQRRRQICTQVRQTVMALHAQGIYPSKHKIDALLPAGWMRKPEAKATWLEVIRELGLKD